jgi:large subunit ribosomal protein L15
MSKKKTQKMRGSKTHGYGAKKKHRGKGSKGGCGYGGSTKHNRSYIYAKEPWHFGHKGFHSLRKKDVAVNIRDLEKLSKGKSELDLTAMGYTKLLSAGDISKPLKIKIKKASKKAKEKIEKAGGSVNE